MRFDLESFTHLQAALERAGYRPHHVRWRRVRAAAAKGYDCTCVICGQPAQWTTIGQIWPWCTHCMDRQIPALKPPPDPVDAAFEKLQALGIWTASATQDLRLCYLGITRRIRVQYDNNAGWEIEHYDDDRYWQARAQRLHTSTCRVVEVVRKLVTSMGLLAEEAPDEP